MLRAEENEILTRVGPGTLMGELLRRYWTPACLTAEIPSPGSPPARVRLLGENLVAFRDTAGRVGLVQENCPHRGASLYFGRNEGASLRCVYHGWAFDTDGRCVDMPSEPAPFCEKVRMKSYPVHESGGIVWTYMGPRETMTPFRDFGTDGRDAGEFIASKQLTTCNWVQAMEGNLDTSHISHLHQFDGIDDIPDDGSDKPGYPSNAMSWKFWRHDRAPRLEVDDTWFGYRYAGIRTTPNGNTHVRVTAYALPYSTMVASIPFTANHGMFVPIDDENCWRYFVNPKQRPNPRGLGGANLFAAAPFSTPITGKTDGIIPRLYTADNDYQLSHEAPAGRQLQRRRRLREPGLHGDRVDGPDLRPLPGAARLHRPGHHPDAAHPAVGGQGPGRGQGAARPGRRLPGDPRRGEDPRAGGGLAGPRHRRRPGRPGGLRHRALTAAAPNGPRPPGRSP